MLLAEDPPMPDFRSIVNPSSDPTQLAKSYLFSGPTNVMNEGGAVPMGYGRLMVGSQVIMASYDIRYVNVDEAGKVI
jgi:predicted phage tail protein